MRIFRSLFFLLLLTTGRAVFAQQITVLDNNPTSLKWYQVKTPHFNVLFPKGFDTTALRVANTLELIHKPESATIGIEPPRISVILQNQSSISNAFVSITPRRSEFFVMPSQDYNFIANNDWLDLITSHEYRHVVQFRHANQGFNRVLYYLFGNNTLSAMANAAVPKWFWEGDAVTTETAFTSGGRGRIPNFGLVFRTNLLEDREFNYHKQYLRSYKHNIPNHYVLGYHMVSYLRKRTGDPEIWEKITGQAWRWSFVPFTFSNAIHRQTGLYVTQLYREMAHDLQKQYHAAIDTMVLTSFDRLNERRSNAYTDYLYPQVLEDGKVIVMKEGIGDIEQLVILNGEDEKHIFTQGMVNSTGMLSMAGGKVVWNEYRYDPRWRVKNYSVVKVYDLASKEAWTVSSAHARYAGAAITTDGKIVTVETTSDYRHTLVVLNAFNGAVLKRFPNPDNMFYSMPRWSADEKQIVALRSEGGKKAVTVIDYESGNMSDLLPLSTENIGYPVLRGNYLFYNSPISGIDNVYAYDLQSNHRYQVTSSRHGAYNPAFSADGKTLYYNEQSRDGLDVAMIPVDPASWRLVDEAAFPLRDLELFNYVVKQESHSHLLDSVPQQQFRIKPYSKFKGIISPYAWGGYVYNDFSRFDFGVSSQDILSTTAINAGYRFDIGERTGLWHADISYQGLYPIIDASFSYGNREVDEGTLEVVRYNQSTARLDTLYKDLIFKWKETNVEANIRLPLLLTRSKYHSTLTLSNAVGATGVSSFKNSIDEGGRIISYDTAGRIYFFRDYTDYGTLLYNHLSIFGSRLLKQSRRDINSRWGQAISVNLYNTPYGGDFMGGQFSTTVLLYFPGLFKHHSFWTYGSYQNTQRLGALQIDDYIFRNQIPLPRGLSITRFENMYSTSANYTLPLWYPDIALGPLLNIQRIRGNAFVDYAYGETPERGISTDYLSVGGEIKADINVFRFLPQLDIGFRYSRGIRPSQSKYEVLLGTFNF